MKGHTHSAGLGPLHSVKLATLCGFVCRKCPAQHSAGNRCLLGSEMAYTDKKVSEKPSGSIFGVETPVYRVFHDFRA